MFLTLALAVTLSKEPTVALFKDKGDMFIKAGTKQGLKVGDEVTVLDGSKDAGIATVMEVFASMSRVTLDATAAKHKKAKTVRLPKSKPAEETAAAAPPPPKPAEKPPEKPAEKPPKPAEPATLKGHATIFGIGPAKQIALYNESDTEWTTCNLRLPDKRHYKLASLRGQDQERIFLHRFEQLGEEIDRPLDSLTVQCDQGYSKFPFE